MIDLVFWAPVMVGGLLAGASSGVLGTFIVGMRIPFLGVCVAHAALAGAVFGSLCGMTGPWVAGPGHGGRGHDRAHPGPGQSAPRAPGR